VPSIIIVVELCGKRPSNNSIRNRCFKINAALETLNRFFAFERSIRSQSNMNLLLRFTAHAFHCHHEISQTVHLLCLPSPIPKRSLCRILTRCSNFVVGFFETDKTHASGRKYYSLKLFLHVEHRMNCVYLLILKYLNIGEFGMVRALLIAM
jgi:hypothetical protein